MPLPIFTDCFWQVKPFNSQLSRDCGCVVWWEMYTGLLLESCGRQVWCLGQQVDRPGSMVQGATLVPDFMGASPGAWVHWVQPGTLIHRFNLVPKSMVGGLGPEFIEVSLVSRTVILGLLPRSIVNRQCRVLLGQTWTLVLLGPGATGVSLTLVLAWFLGMQ